MAPYIIPDTMKGAIDTVMDRPRTWNREESVEKMRRRELLSRGIYHNCDFLDRLGGLGGLGYRTVVARTSIRRSCKAGKVVLTRSNGRKRLFVIAGGYL